MHAFCCNCCSRYHHYQRYRRRSISSTEYGTLAMICEWWGQDTDASEEVKTSATTAVSCRVRSGNNYARRSRRARSAATRPRVGRTSRLLRPPDTPFGDDCRNPASASGHGRDWRRRRRARQQLQSCRRTSTDERASGGRRRRQTQPGTVRPSFIGRMSLNRGQPPRPLLPASTQIYTWNSSANARRILAKVDVAPRGRRTTRDMSLPVS